MTNKGTGTAIVTAISVLVDDNDWKVQAETGEHGPPKWKEVQAPFLAEDWTPILTKVGLETASYNTIGFGSSELRIPPGGSLSVLHVWGAEGKELTKDWHETYRDMLQYRLVIFVHYKSVYREVMKPAWCGAGFGGIPKVLEPGDPARQKLPLLS